MLKQKIESKFQLNDMQIEAINHIGQNLIFNAPTGSGKTEAILLSILPNTNSVLMLPTITSCIFMYYRLVHDFGNFVNITIKTSLLTEAHKTVNAEGYIEICCPDAPFIEYLKAKREGVLYNPFVGINTLILDEVDNYPPMVKRALIEFMHDFPNIQYIVASATLDKQLTKCFKSVNCYEIVYRQDLQLIKHKIQTICYSDIRNIVLNNTDKKIGIICNSIAEMEFIKSQLYNIKYLYHHAQLTEYERLQNEQKLFSGDFRVVIGNDLLSYSIDVDFDILIMSLSDKLNLNIQRLGRNNRYNKKVYYTNLYIISPYVQKEAYHVDSYDVNYIYNKYFSNKNILTYQYIKQLKNELIPEEIPSLSNIWIHWNKLESNGLELNLRSVPISFAYETTINIKEYNKITKQLEEKQINTIQVIKVNDDDYYSNAPYTSKNATKKELVYLKGQVYRIIGYEKNYIKIEPYNGDAYLDCPECGRRIADYDFHWGKYMCYDCYYDNYGDRYY